jgi:hypothetical protein
LIWPGSDPVLKNLFNPCTILETKVVVFLCTYKRYGSTDGSDLRIRIKMQVHIVEFCVCGGYLDESGRTKQWVDEGSKRQTEESREWFMDGTRQRKESFGGQPEGNWYEVQSGRKRGMLQSEW